MKKVFITTAIDYANDVIHIGHAYEKILADAIARYYRLKLGPQNVLFTTGTDEHGTTNEKAAKSKEMSPRDYVDIISAEDKKELDALNISYSRFIRTTDPDHIKTAQEFFLNAYKNGDIYKHTYEGLYCEGCESYKTLSELDENGRCPNHKTKELQKTKEENYFFRWSKYVDFLKQLIGSDSLKIYPQGKKNEILSFLNQGILDIPITRPKYKVSWGIECPIDESQVIYVWFDALINYYTEGSQKGFWDEDTKIIHFVGKDIAKWHALLWPAMLKSVNAKIPNEICVHSFMLLNGQKISKSLGNVIRPSELVNKFGSDAVRYYLLKHGPLLNDVDVSVENLKEVYNADLANGLGNLVARIAKICEKWNLDLKNDINVNWNAKWTDHLEEFRVDLMLQEIWEQMSLVDKHINQNEPWKITDPKTAQEILKWEVGQIVEIARKLEPFMPTSSEKILQQFLAPMITHKKALFPRV